MILRGVVRKTSIWLCARFGNCHGHYISTPKNKPQSGRFYSTREIIKKTITSAIFLIAVFTRTHSAIAQIDTKNSIKVASNDDVRCKKNVTQYTETLRFLRQSAGEQVSSKVMGNYVPLEQLNQVVSSSGYCAGEQLPRDKKALR